MSDVQVESKDQFQEEVELSFSRTIEFRIAVSCARARHAFAIRAAGPSSAAESMGPLVLEGRQGQRLGGLSQGTKHSTFV